MNRASNADDNLPTYVADTHVLYWYLNDASRLSPAADAVFRLAEAGHARIIIPAIVVAELYFLSIKRRKPLPPATFFEYLANAQGLYFTPLGRAQVEKLADLPDVPDIHDRLIAAEALANQCPLVTKDEALRRSAVVQTIW